MYLGRMLLLVCRVAPFEGDGFNGGKVTEVAVVMEAE